MCKWPETIVLRYAPSGTVISPMPCLALATRARPSDKKSCQKYALRAPLDSIEYVTNHEPAMPGINLCICQLHHVVQVLLWPAIGIPITTARKTAVKDSLTC